MTKTRLETVTEAFLDMENVGPLARKMPNVRQQYLRKARRFLQAWDDEIDRQAAEARMAGDNGVRHFLEDVAEAFGVEL